jgi:hypothetical protein
MVLDERPQHRAQHDQSVGDAVEEANPVAVRPSERCDGGAFGPVDGVEERDRRRPDRLEEWDRVADERVLHDVERALVVARGTASDLPRRGDGVPPDRPRRPAEPLTGPLPSVGGAHPTVGGGEAIDDRGEQFGPSLG